MAKGITCISPNGEGQEKVLNKVLDYLNNNVEKGYTVFDILSAADIVLNREGKETLAEVDNAAVKILWEFSNESKNIDRELYNTVHYTLNHTPSQNSQIIFKDNLNDGPFKSSELLLIGRGVIKTMMFGLNKMFETDENGFTEAALDYLIDIIGNTLDVKQLKNATPLTYLMSNYDWVWPKLIDYALCLIAGIDLSQDDYDFIIDNINAIVNRSFSTLVDIANLSITSNETAVNAQGVQSEEEQNHILELMEEDGREAYAIDNRSISYEESMPAEVKRRLALIPRLDLKREIVRDKYGLPLFEDKHAVINYLEENLHFYNNSTSMLEALNELAQSTPWVQQIIDMINRDSKFKTEFFVTFRTNATKYTHIYKEVTFKRGSKVVRYKVKALNENNVLKRLQDEAVNAWQSATLPEGIKNTANGIRLDSDKFNKGLSNLVGVDYLIASLKKLGITSIEDSDLLRALLQTGNNAKKVNSSLDNLVNALKSGRKISEALYRLTQNLAAILPRDSLISERAAGKTYMRYTSPTYLETVIDKLSGVNLQYADLGRTLPEEFRGWQHVLSMDDEGATMVSSWLSTMLAYPDTRPLLLHFVHTTTDDAHYFKLSDLEYFRTLYCTYFAPVNGLLYIQNAQDDVAAFAVPMMSDKNACEFITFLKCTGDTADQIKKNVAADAYNFFLFELNRIKDTIAKVLDEDATDVDNISLDRHNKQIQHLAKLLNNKNTKNEEILKALRDNKSALLKSGASFRYLPLMNFIFELENNITNRRAKKTAADNLTVDIINYLKGVSEFSNTMGSHFETVFIEKMDEEFNNEFIPMLEELFPEDADKETLFASANEGGTIADNMVNLVDYYYNTYLANMNIIHLLCLDISFFKNTNDFQKRFAQVHSSTIKVDTEATFTTNSGNVKRLTDGNHRFIVVDDLEMPSKLAAVAKKIFEDRAARETEQEKKDEFKRLAVFVENFFKEKFTASDGQALSSPTGMWKKYNLIADADPQYKKALDNIRNGEFTEEDVLTACMLPFKPFVYTKIKLRGLNGRNDYVPVQIKDSEAMILFAGALLNNQKDSPLYGIFKFLEHSHYSDEVLHTDDTYKADGIDTIVFKSAVKVGAANVVDISGETADEVYDKLIEAAYDERGNYTNAVQVMDFEDWGRQQVVPAHNQDGELPIGSQERVIAVSDLDDNEKIVVNGIEYSKLDFLKEYFSLINEDFVDGIAKVKNKFNYTKESGVNNETLSGILLKSILNDAKYSNILYDSLKLDKKSGDFVVSPGDPSISNKVYSTIYSAIKRAVNEEKMPGGPIVQMSSYGLTNDLGIKDGNGQYLTVNGKLNPKFNASTGIICEIYITCPTSELERAIFGTNKTANHSVEELVDLGIITRELLDCIAARIPTEDKYSIFRCEIKGFLPRSGGEKIMMPHDVVILSGTDFDIDKMFILYRPFSKKESDRSNRAFIRKQRIFDLQWAALGTRAATESFLNPGNYELLKDLAVKLDGDDYKSGGNIMSPVTQVNLRRKNAAGKEFVGIAALNNISHSICAFSKTSFRGDKIGLTKGQGFLINGGKHLGDIIAELGNKLPFDTAYSLFDGSRISKNIGMFVGASADNAKEALLGLHNITPVTGTMAMGLMRMGLPTEFVIYAMRNPAVRKISDLASISGNRFENELLEFINSNKLDQNGELLNHLNSFNFTYEEMENRAKRDKNNRLLTFDMTELNDVDKAVLGMLKWAVPYVQAISDLNAVTSLNSTKNSVGPTVFDTIRKEYKIRNFILQYQERKGLNNITSTPLIDSSLFDAETFDLLDDVRFLKPLIQCYTEVSRDLLENFSPFYLKDFRGVLDYMDSNFLKVADMSDKQMKNLLNGWLLYKASIFGLIDGDLLSRESFLYDVPQELLDAKNKYANENLFLKALIYEKAKRKSPFMGIALKNAGSSKEHLQDLSAEWDNLADENPKLSNLLLEYAIRRYGFTWHPNSAVNIASEKVKNTFVKNAGNIDVDYNMLFLDFGEQKEQIIMNFLLQYFRNNPSSRFWVALDKQLSADKLSQETLQALDEQQAKGVKIGKTLYTVSHDADGNILLLETPPLGEEGLFMEYNAFEEDEYFEMTAIDKDKFIKTNFDEVISESDDLGEDANAEETDGTEIKDPQNPKRTSSASTLNEIDDAVLNASNHLTLENTVFTELLASRISEQAYKRILSEIEKKKLCS